ncbi:SIMPL domain-containing protein [Haploplasma axanthum]|uniref:Oxidative stress defense protein n=1 Tax=Haploplasma axanthum TaxID=29552 RepID=A0A449BBR6_HAPAX|nr:SIMPL domain-containing protein [Haploplasma axanthum]VEU79891.1 oxidative stress defense protein [Haploplasma axanthum]
MERVIKVRSKGRVFVKPNRTVVTMNVETRGVRYDDAVNDANSVVEDLVHGISRRGINKEDIKTTYYNVRAEYSDDNKERIVKGFLCTQALKIEFDLDNRKLGEILEIVSGFNTTIRFDIEFTVEDTDSVIEAVLIDATKNATKKANMIARASNVSLGNILAIDNKTNEYGFVSATRFNMDANTKSSYRMSIEPENIEVSEYLEFIFEIK